ncbi:hypothetical protein EPUS_06681 [Endocarpon pusillum Z07020]|uniref:Uncharacterized protein n=1 Tax=Endocarpon pusillum (strain Z07020 / HMAS-L-300199) TaxID=1263415 RepID=U1HJ97_ENDPU|nr:uncharacterized protein EPUS_06681 [Endocarpon pusillum Z07020]ERF68994.1 hypothetical protein EPUS_06681 [Endocarpon pusillum Z07020]
MFELRDAASTAQQTDMKVVVDDISSSSRLPMSNGEIKTLIYCSDVENETRNERFGNSNCFRCLNSSSKDRGSGYKATGCGRIKLKCYYCTKLKLEWRNYQAIRDANLLIESNFADILPSEEEILSVQKRSSRLSAKDHWENNGILDNLRVWSDLKAPSLLWIGGQSGNQDPWITAFSADLTDALGSQEIDGLQIPVFLQYDQVWRKGPTDVLHIMIKRFVEKRPTLLMELPHLLNSRTLRRTGSFSNAVRMIRGIAEWLEATFIIIDRFDLAETDEDDVSVNNDLLSYLLDLVELGSDKIRIVVTSTQMPPSKWQDDTRLTSVWLDTGIRPGKRDRR